MTTALSNFDFTSVNFNIASLSVPMGTFEFDTETRFFVGLEIFNATTAEAQLRIIDCDTGLDDLADNDSFVAALQNHLSNILRCPVKVALNENVGDLMLFDLL